MDVPPVFVDFPATLAPPIVEGISSFMRVKPVVVAPSSNDLAFRLPMQQKQYMQPRPIMAKVPSTIPVVVAALGVWRKNPESSLLVT